MTNQEINEAVARKLGWEQNKKLPDITGIGKENFARWYRDGEISSCEKGYMVKKYGCLHPDTWKEDLKQGFAECWRVLDDYGTLTFKWNEAHIPIAS